MPETVRVPVDVAALKGKLSNVLANKSNPAKTTEVKPQVNRGANQDAAEQRRKAKEMAKTVEEKDALLTQLQQELDEAKRVAEEATKKAAELEPQAKSWKKHEDTERARLMEKLLPEFKADAKDLPIGALRNYVKMASGGATTAQGTDDKGKGRDWQALYTGDDEAAFNKAMEEDPKGWDEFLKGGSK